MRTHRLCHQTNNENKCQQTENKNAKGRILAASDKYKVGGFHWTPSQEKRGSFKSVPPKKPELLLDESDIALFDNLCFPD